MANNLVAYNSGEMDVIFHALADPTRRNILERLTDKTLTVTEIAKSYSFSLPTISNHLTVLEKAHLVKRNRYGREHRVNFEPDTMRAAVQYVSFYKKFWSIQIDNLEKFLSREKNNNGKK